METVLFVLAALLALPVGLPGASMVSVPRAQRLSLFGGVAAVVLVAIGIHRNRRRKPPSCTRGRHAPPPAGRLAATARPA